MTEPGVRKRLPWLTVLTAAVLAGFLAVLYRPSSGTLMAPAVWAAAVAGVAAFLAFRWWQNYFWGVVAGLLPLHLVLRSAAGPAPYELLALALELAVLAGTVAGWRLSYWSRFAALSWGLTAVVLTAGVGLAWPLHPRTGLVAGAFAGVGQLAGAVLATLFLRRGARARPSWLNVSAAVLVGLAAPPAGLVLAPASVRYLGWPAAAALRDGKEAEDLLQAAVDPPAAEDQEHGFSTAGLRHWCWPSPWVVLPLMGWGFWRALRRGAKDVRRHRPPAAWVLVLFALAVLIGAAVPRPVRGEAAILALTSLATLLALYGVADLVRGLMERLVLAPPEERDE